MDKIQNFFMKNASPNDKEWETFTSCDRCAGFTLAYGSFYNISDLIENCTKKDEDYFDKVIEYIDKLNTKYPYLTFSRLPCCWPDETGFDLFVGFNVYPLIWYRPGDYYVKDRSLVCNENNDGDKEYELPNYLRDIVVDIFDEYRQMSWKNALYVENYCSFNKYIDMLNDLYCDKINKFNTSIGKIIELNNKISEKGWSFIPSDCASCS
jgi:hypothetical protein